MEKQESITIIFFDGVCILCNGFADFVLKFDHKRTLKLAALQGAKAQLYLNDEDLKNMDSILLYKDGTILRSSDAVLEILSIIGGFWKVLSWLKVVPRFIREPIYRFIANNRYRFFGKQDSCRLPLPEEKDRFFD